MYVKGFRDFRVKRVASKNDVPTTKHYVVLIYKSNSVWIPGDERSKNYPGHGYPERTETYESFEHYVATNKTEWEEFVTALYKSGETNFVFFEVPVVGTLEVSVAIK